MVLAVPENQLKKLTQLCTTFDVAITDIGVINTFWEAIGNICWPGGS